MLVTAANLAERKGAIQLLEQIRDKFPRLEKIFADGGYQGEDFPNQVQEDDNLVELKSYPSGAVAQPKPDRQ